MRDTEQQITHTTLRVEGIDLAGEIYCGTAFVFNHQVRPGVQMPLVVSNKHVLRRDFARLTVRGLGRTEGNEPDYGTAVNLDLGIGGPSATTIHYHPDPKVDLAGFAVGQALSAVPIFHKAIATENMLPKDEEAAGLRRKTFERIMFVGYPNGYYDTHNVMPITRFGDLATPLDLDYEGLPAFLIDAGVFGGSSGSPVFAYRHFHRVGPEGISWGEEPYFVGVVAAVHTKNEFAPLVETAALRITKELGLGLVFRAGEVLRLAKTIEAAATTGFSKKDASPDVHVQKGIS